MTKALAQRIEQASVSVHPNNQATKASGADTAYALTLSSLKLLVADARDLLAKLCNSQLSGSSLLSECASLLSDSKIRPERLIEYLKLFVGVE